MRCGRMMDIANGMLSYTEMFGGYYEFYDFD